MPDTDRKPRASKTLTLGQLRILIERTADLDDQRRVSAKVTTDGWVRVILFETPADLGKSDA